MTDLNLSEWQQDGHRFSLTLGLFNGRDKNDGMVKATIECPPGSTCRKWHADHGGTTDSEPYCHVRGELDALGNVLDFIDMDMTTTTLPDDWEVSAEDMPIEIEWRDRGEDGVEWRPLRPTEPPAEEQSGSLTRLAEGMV